MTEKSVPISTQKEFWNRWNAQTRENDIQEVSRRQASVVKAWLDSLGGHNLDILEVGCGAGWFCGELAQYGAVTATDLSDEVLGRAQRRLPHVTFVAGDFMSLDLGAGRFDVIVTLEVLSHVEDQRAFVARLAQLLRPSGYLMMATQNRPVLQRWNAPKPVPSGQIRQWVDRRELEALLTAHFDIVEMFSVTPIASRGIMRFVNARLVNRPIRAIAGDRIERLKEAMDLGWTLMALGRKI